MADETNSGSKLFLADRATEVALSQGDFETNVLCGGSYVHGSDGYVKVLTAATCVKWIIASKLRLFVTFNLYDRSHPNGSVTLEATNIIPHPQNSHVTLMHDLAIIETGRRVSDMDPGAVPICLAKSGQGNDEPVWGTTSSGAHVTNDLRYVRLNIVPLKECRAGYLQQPGFIIHTDMTCAGEEGKDPCIGDRGGPLAAQTNEGVWELLGVVSWGYGCDVAGYPGVYSSVTDRQHQHWLVNNL